ncbi:MAG: protein phosphatase [Anaerolineales bacterium]|nr:protein phosphatase [Anaerolineales bacterium]
MERIWSLINKGADILRHRLRTQGVRTTLLWFLVRGSTFVTGIPTIRYTRIAPQIFVGPQYRRMGKRKLERHGVNASLNMRLEFDDAAHGLDMLRYCHLPTADDHPPSLEQLNTGAAFIDQVVRDGGKVYIHCAGGIGRAPMMAAAYFVSQGLDLEEAIARIRNSRPFIRIMPSQVTRLRQFEDLVKREDSG